MQQTILRKVEVKHSSDLSALRKASNTTAAAIGFDEKENEEIVLAVSELASNLVRHAGGGTVILTPFSDDGRSGIQIESMDKGPGIPDMERAMTDGFSTVGSLGYGLGTVNRLMDEFDIRSQPGAGTYIVCRRWVHANRPNNKFCPLSFGAATRPHPRMGLNGDAFIIKQWEESALVGVIDGLGHGQWAQRAAQTARRYVESHFAQLPEETFRGVGRLCRATRGVVMALARFDWEKEKLTFASIGNIETRIFNSPEPVKFVIRRGIIGLNAPNPVVTQHHWVPGSIMVMHSDGVETHWQWEDFPELANEAATITAQRLLHVLAKEEDDATVVVVRGKPK
jgi:anti-sigma regulatory factor (Ser/Thr protein kinase)/serine/threonine protein phosphatase PrpC